MAVWRYRLAKLFRLGGGELVELVVAQVLLLWVRLLVAIMPRGRLVGLQAPTGASVPGDGDHARAQRLALAVGRAAEHGIFRPTCLVRAVALIRLLRWHGITSARLRIGVRMREGTLMAHAWVELGGEVLGDSESKIRVFTPMAGVSPVGS